jgi:hypothetical protein
MTFKTMVARLRKGLYIIAAIGLPAVAAAQSVPDVIGPIPGQPAAGNRPHPQLPATVIGTNRQPFQSWLCGGRVLLPRRCNELRDARIG